jgi:hypothetical protein
MPKSKKSAAAKRRRREEEEEDHDDDTAKKKERSPPAPTTPPKKKKQRGVIDLTTPDKKVSTAAFVTPPPKQVSSKKKEEYVPHYIHKNVEYHREGEAELPAIRKKLFEIVTQHYVVPDNFEQNRRYGPLSGTCYEERVIQAYALNNLDAVDPEEQTKICTECAEIGHKRSDCPALI